MGLDLVLAAMVLIAALRGWLKGFVLQAVRLGGMVACVYEAGPVRDLVRPHVTEYLKGIKPELLDRMLWWAAAVVSYLVTVGLATLLVRAYRRRPYGEPDLYRGDQAAGLLLGAAKGALVVIFLVSSVEKHALSHLKNLPWAEQQAATSHALVWNEKYHPADRIWSAQPVQLFVAHVQKEGLNPPAGAGEPATEAVRTASRPKDRDLPNEIPSPAKALEELKAAVDALDSDVSKRESRNWR